MIIGITNLSGNTGKSTLAKHLFTPLLGANTRRIQVENVNSSDGEPDLEMTAKQFKTLAGELNLADDGDNYVIDMGASNAPAMILNFQDFSTTRNTVDYWIVPVVPSKKVVTDSVATVKKLLEIGVDASKIVIIFNNVTDTDSVKSDFAPLYIFEKLGVHIASEAVLASDVFEAMKGSSETVFDIAAKSLDLKALKKAALESPDPKRAFSELAHLSVLFDMATTSVANLQSVFRSTPIHTAMLAKA